MKSIIIKICLASLLLLGAVSAQARTFKFATIIPDGTNWMKIIRAGADEIKTKTQGRVKFKFYTGGVMGTDKSVLKKIRIGQLHGGMLTGGGLSQVYSDAQIYSLPFMFRNLKEVDYVRSKMDPLIYAGLKDKGMIVLGLGEGGFAYFMTKSPVENVDNLGSLKNWMPEGDTIGRSLYEAANISPVPLPISDVYTGLQTGLIDTVTTNTTAAIAFQWHTKVKYVTDVPLIYLLGAMVMDQRAFNKINADDQKIVQQVMGGVFKQLDKINREDNQKAREALLNNHIKFVKLSPADMQRWQNIASKAKSNLVSNGFFSKHAINEIEKLLTTYRKK